MGCRGRRPPQIHATAPVRIVRVASSAARVGATGGPVLASASEVLVKAVPVTEVVGEAVARAEILVLLTVAWAEDGGVAIGVALDVRADAGATAGWTVSV